MAATIPHLKRSRVFAAKTESEAGTAETLTATEGVFNCHDLTINPNIDMVKRDSQGSFSSMPAIPGTHLGSVSFSIYLHGDDSAGAHAAYETLLPACGWIQTGEYFLPTSLPVGTGSAKTITIGVFQSGLLKRLAGCMGTFTIECVNGKPVEFKFTFTGVWVAPSDLAVIAPTYPTPLPLRFASATLTLVANVPLISRITIDAGNDVQMLEDPTDASGYLNAIITGRECGGSHDPQSVLVADDDRHADLLAMTEQALSITVGSAVAGKECTITAPKLQYTNLQEADRNGLMIEDITFQLNRSAAAGDDELKIDFTHAA